MVTSKLDEINTLSRFLNNKKWRLLTNLRLKNLKANKILRPTNDSEIGKLQVEINNLSFYEKDYRDFVNSDVLSKYNQLDYIHSSLKQELLIIYRATARQKSTKLL